MPSADDANPPLRLSRRRFLRAGASSAAGSILCGLGPLTALPDDAAFPGGRFVGRVAFEDEEVAQANKLLGAELDGRLYTDLSRVTMARQLTPTSEFFIRSAASRLLPDAAHWRISIDGGLDRSKQLDLPSLRNVERPMGRHLIECAGNVRLTRFGLISVADWTGVPVAEVIEHTKPKIATWVQISGFDEYAAPSATSVPGASWIFPLERLISAGAFLATGMNGQPLTPDHGAPVRLVVPGWYGCSCIKWVDRIALVDGQVGATSQMQEYAVRTLQQGIPELARDFQPATIDHAAIPVRIEKWNVAGRVRYRIVGILWGGSQPIRTLQIRFNPGDTFVPVMGIHQVKTDPWTIWTHNWSPTAPGMHTIRMAVVDPPVRTRKLDLGLYDRSVNIIDI